MYLAMGGAEQTWRAIIVVHDDPRAKVSALCQKCSWHVEVKIIRHKPNQYRCPTINAPMHHFVFRSSYLSSPSHQYYHFECSVCCTVLMVTYRIPRLPRNWIDLLTNEDNLTQRCEVAQRRDPTSRKYVKQTGMKVLEALSTYIKDALACPPGEPPKEIPAYNKRFMTTFGEDCHALLEWLGFEKATVLEGEDEHEVWKLPVAPPPPGFDAENKRTVLEDVMEELYAEMRRMLAANPTQPKPQRPIPAIAGFEASVEEILDCETYEKSVNRLGAINSELECRYTGLGAVHDMSDKLIIYAFRRQRDCDPMQTSYYFDCLSNIGSERQSEELNMELGFLASEGHSSMIEVTGAYHALGYRLEEVGKLSDDDILGGFNARLESSHPAQEAELREKLRVLGRARGSDLLISAADNGKRLFSCSFPDSSFSFSDPSCSISSPSAATDVSVELFRVTTRSQRKVSLQQAQHNQKRPRLDGEQPHSRNSSPVLDSCVKSEHHSGGSPDHSSKSQNLEQLSTAPDDLATAIEVGSDPESWTDTILSSLDTDFFSSPPLSLSQYTDSPSVRLKAPSRTKRYPIIASGLQVRTKVSSSPGPSDSFEKQWERSWRDHENTREWNCLSWSSYPRTFYIASFSLYI